MTPPLTKRQQLGEAIAFRLDQQRRTNREVADRCGISREDVERFRAGLLVPDARTWKRLCEQAARALHADHQLFLQARVEQDAEREVALKGLQRMNGHRNGAPAATTNLGDKIRPVIAVSAPDARTVNPGQAVTYHAAPEPARPAGPQNPGAYAHAYADLGIPIPDERAKDGRIPPPPRPEGTMSHEARARRRAYVRELLQQRPHARASGDDDVIQSVRKTFGVGIDPSVVEEVRRELEAERLEAKMRAKLELEQSARDAAAAAPPPVPVPVGRGSAQLAVPAPVHDDAIAEAVALIVSEIPGLRRMTIEVSDAGEASYTFEVAAVRVGGGSVRR